MIDHVESFKEPHLNRRLRATALESTTSMTGRAPTVVPLKAAAASPARASDADLQALDRWEAYRAEIEDLEGRMKALAFNFLELGDYESASRCTIKAEGLRFVRGRMPPARTPTKS